MHQYSVYSRLLLNGNANSVLIDRLKANNHNKGFITILTVTEKQFARMVYLHGEKDESVANTDNRLVFLGEDYGEEY